MIRHLTGAAAFACFVGSIWLANFLILNVGDPQDGTVHTIPVGFGLIAPSGVMAVGLGLTMRDVLHELAGRKVCFLAIAAGSLVSALLSPQLAAGSAAGFLAAETSDLLVYERIRRRSKWLAISVSNLVGSVTDSITFLGIAFGLSAIQTYAVAQVIGKWEWSLAALPLMVVLRLVRPSSVAYSEPRAGQPLPSG